MIDKIYIGDYGCFLEKEQLDIIVPYYVVYDYETKEYEIYCIYNNKKYYVNCEKMLSINEVMEVIQELQGVW